MSSAKESNKNSGSTVPGDHYLAGMTGTVRVEGRWASR